MTPPDALKRLVEKFDQNKSQYLSPTYNEAQLRQEFLDPFFGALGWDIENQQGISELYKEVIHEDSIKIGGETKAPDYAFRIGKDRKFFVEAKKPSVSIKENPLSAFQLRRYAWTAKLPLSILTDFQEFAVYDTRISPSKADKAATARIQLIAYEDYIPKWEEICAVFSRDAVWHGSFDKYVIDTRKKKGTEEVDDAFLKEIELWRDLLARNIALRNPRLTVQELNFSVQRTIDRIIFLRICEDRGIESYASLRALLNGERIYKRMQELFHRADERYNSGLFHFRAEKARPDLPDELTLELIIDDKPLKEIIGGLYYPDCPYEFSVLPADILGQVYEQFLGKVIRLTAGHQAKVEAKPEVKKTGGVYYTPTYVVEYIVKTTVGRLVEDRTPKLVSVLRVIDPACGSGSFLIGAYQYLLDWHREWYVKDGAEKWFTGKNATIFKGPGGEWRLTTTERKRILLNNIYGVDIDSQAVEVTKLSLLLKVLEGESDQSITLQLKMFHERALPDLGSNIKCGNSLIGLDFFDAELVVDQEERDRINAFDWEVEFREIMVVGGFDAVIGNPPYVRQEVLGTDFKQYAAAHFRVYHSVADLYAYFIERGISLLRRDGVFGYIVSNKWMRANYGEPLRRWLKAQGLVEIIDFGDLSVFEDATTYPCILRIRKTVSKEPVSVTQIQSLTGLDLGKTVSESSYQVDRSYLHDSGWSLANQATARLLEKLRSTGIPLGEYVQGKIYYGIKTGLNEAFVIDAETKTKLNMQDPNSAELLKPFLAGRDIKRYQQPRADRFLILIPNGWTNQVSKKVTDKWSFVKKRYPAIARHLEPFKGAAEKRHDKGGFWWELRPCDYYNEFEKPKILWPEIATSARFTIDRNSLYANNKVFVIPDGDPYLLGLLNSSLLKLFIHNVCTDLQGDSFNFSAVFVERVPIYPASRIRTEDELLYHRLLDLVTSMSRLMKELTASKTDHEKTALQRRIDATDKQIDTLICGLYGLTEEEARIVENSSQVKG